MTRQVLIISHADADGHLIAEQTRRNLDLVESFDVDVVVDPERTKDHKVWLNLNTLPEIDDADYVFFVDLMFAPTSYAEEAAALVDFVRARPGKRFFLIDHHPLPLHRLEPADNLRVMYRPDVFDCAIGPRSGMMVVAALCEKQADRVAAVKQPAHDVLAKGVKRAAALGGPLPGAKLLALLRHDEWHSLAALGEDDREFHQLPRGRRPAGRPYSETLKKLDEMATRLVKAENGDKARREDMAYDMEALDRYDHQGDQPARMGNARVNPRDLEAIVTLLEIAALSLTKSADATFTLKELIEEAKRLGGDEIEIEDKDVRIVLGKFGFLKSVGGGEYRLK